MALLYVYNYGNLKEQNVFALNVLEECYHSAIRDLISHEMLDINSYKLEALSFIFRIRTFQCVWPSRWQND